jgi:ABC-type dipeptide/oligopeptide/nickel transport system permease component
MLEYTLRRLGGTIPVVLGILAIAFVVLYLIPGDPAATLAGPRATPEAIARLSEQMGLDLPLPVRFGRYLGRMAVGDLGRSVITGKPVLESILEKVPTTLRLSFLAMLIAVVGGVGMGILGAIFRGRLIDRLVTMTSVTGISIPVFLSGLIILYVFAVKAGWFPMSAFRAGDSWMPFVLPAFTLGIRSAAFLARIVRSSLIEVLQQDYIRTARAKGLSPWRILWRHALVNALIPIITVIGLDVSSYLNGSVIVETIFGLPGLGRFAMDAILKRDYPEIQGVVLFAALVFVIMNVFVDLVYAWVNPRIREEMLGRRS